MLEQEPEAVDLRAVKKNAIAFLDELADVREELLESLGDDVRELVEVREKATRSRLGSKDAYAEIPSRDDSESSAQFAVRRK